AAAGDAELVIHDRAVTGDQVHVVGEVAGLNVLVLQRGEELLVTRVALNDPIRAAVLARGAGGLALELRVALTAERLQLVVDLLNAVPRVVGYQGGAGLTLLGGDEHHAIRATR